MQSMQSLTWVDRMIGNPNILISLMFAYDLHQVRGTVGLESVFAQYSIYIGVDGWMDG